MEIEDGVLSGVENSDLKDGTFYFPNGVKYIGKLGFYNCTKLEYLNIPEGILGIGEYAFRCCKRLSRVKIPSSVTSIRGSSFAIPEFREQANPLKTVIVTPDRKIDDRFRACLPPKVEIVVKSMNQDKPKEL